ncbi:ArsR/SmtB family transcription factor [Pseudooceanicola nitratireducens]|uniref:ArsR/SmtB family transcription factor n=1 Tax=Pseudooceanicola nitratireducens TaxID=517719 RepID=UPI00351681EA
MHPPIEDITLQAVLYALADPVRLTIFADLVGATAPKACAIYLTVNGAPVPKSTLSQHFRILREHGLIRSERRGVEMLSTARKDDLDCTAAGSARTAPGRCRATAAGTARRENRPWRGHPAAYR